MDLFFANQALVALAVLVVIPLLVHLFARSKPPRYRFSSVEFIRRVLRNTTRLKRPRDWFILFLRTLLVMAVVGVFLRPVFFSDRALGTPFQRRNVVVLVDRTASMAYQDGGQSRFSVACAEASELLEGLTRRDAANIIWLDAQPDAVFPQLGPNVTYLREQLRRATVSMEGGNLHNAIDQAVALLADVEGNREISIVSDFQASFWQASSFPDTKGISVVCIPVARSEAANKAVGELRVTPASALPGERVSVACDVWNYGAEPVRASVYAVVGESRQSRELLIEPWSKAVVVFETVFTDVGEYPVVISLSEDTFPADNAAYAVARVKPHLRCALLGRADDPGKTWEKALSALGCFHVVQVASATDLVGQMHDVVLVSGWQGEGGDVLRQAAQEGAVVVCSPEAALPISRLRELAGQPVGDDSGELLSHEVTEPNRLRLVLPDDPLFALFRRGDYGDPSRGLFRRRLLIPDLAADGVQVLLAYEDGVPALVRLQGGSLYLWNLGLDSMSSNWPAQAPFIPLFGELLMSRRLQRSFVPSIVPGMRAQYKKAMHERVEDIALVPIEGSESAPNVSLGSDGLQLVSEPFVTPGLFAWQVKEASRTQVAVNFPHVESDLRTVAPETLKAGISAVVESGRRARQLRDGIEMWPWLLALGVLLAVGEGVAVWRMGGGR